MDTGAHIVCNLLIQGRHRLPRLQLFAVVIIGAIAPDLPIIAFYAWEALVLNTPEHVIWSERYYLPGWQNFIDAFNSIPITLGLLAVAAAIRCKSMAVLLAGVLLHIALDLPLHHDDAHRHLFPISDWRYESPVSYWDPAHYGNILMPLQAMFVAAGLVWLWFRHRGRFERAALVALGSVYLSFIVFAAVVWG